MSNDDHIYYSGVYIAHWQKQAIAGRWSSFAGNEKHIRPECSFMKKHLTPESNYIPSAGAQGTNKMAVVFWVQGPPWAGQSKGLCVPGCHGKVMIIISRLRWGEGFRGEREWCSCPTQKPCIITTRWEGFVSSLECSRVLKRRLDWRSKNSDLYEAQKTERSILFIFASSKNSCLSYVANLVIKELNANSTR